MEAVSVDVALPRPSGHWVTREHPLTVETRLGTRFPRGQSRCEPASRAAALGEGQRSKE